MRLANGDTKGAMDSRLDAMELGAVVGHGMLISMFVDTAVEFIGLNKIDKVASHLDATQCRAAIARLANIEAHRTTLTETLRHEQKYDLNQSLQTLGTPKDLDSLKPSEDGTFPTAQDIAQFKALTPAKITENSARLFDAVVQSTQLPYSKAVATQLPTDLDPWTQLLVEVLKDARYRFSYEGLVTQNRLLRAALELRAQKLETGKYPESFIAPTDPFAPATQSLIYQKTTQDYLLYSVGPDGKDDGGAEIQTLETNEEAGIKTVSDHLKPESTGDIVQTPF